MPDSITRCPKCRTSFRVSNNHLSTARGAVRCGSCLTIFNAKEHLLNIPEADTPEPAVTQTTSIPKSSDFIKKRKPARSMLATKVHQQQNAEPQALDDDMLISDDMPGLGQYDNDDNEEAIYSPKLTTTIDTNLFERSYKEDEKKLPANADETWALNLIEDSEEEGKPERSDKVHWHKKTDDKDTLAYSNPAFQVIEDDEEIYPNDTQESILELFNDKPLEETTTKNTKPSSKKKEDKKKNRYECYDDETYQNFDRTGYFNAIEPEPLELHTKIDRQIWQSPMLWSLLCLAAAAVAFFQVGYLKFDTWSRDTTLRPYYAKACGFMSCSLPAMQDLSRIRVQNLAIITHPNASNILLVDAILVNQAKFEQAFPTLEITFSNKAGNTVGTFQFQPNDYVGGELAGKKMMPANHPIHINVTIPDPGPEAINYNIRAVNSEA